MKVAQELYEGVDIEGMGATGLITYMRTDSLRISNVAIEEVTEYIKILTVKSFFRQSQDFLNQEVMHRTVMKL